LRFAVAAFVVAAALFPQVAFAHAQLIQSGPPSDAIMAELPPVVELVFSEPVSPAGAGIKVFSPSSRQIAGPVVSRGAVLYAPMSSAETGTFVVSWQVLAADTHPSRGAFRFSIGRPSANPYSSLLTGGDIGTATPLGFVLQALARWVHFVGFALVFGAVAYRALTRDKQPNHRPVRRLVGAGIVLLIAAEPLALLGQLASLSFDTDTAIAVLASGFGRLLALRLAGALLVWALWSVESPWPVLGVGVATALIDGASAHAIPGLPVVGQLLVSVHVASMGLWVGGLAAFLVAPDRRFVRYAALCFGVAAVSGLLLAVAHVGVLQSLMTTPYGQVLMVKVLVVGAALSMVVLRRRRLEFGVLLTVIAAAAALAALPPPR
jgi:copper transport protein